MLFYTSSDPATSATYCGITSFSLPEPYCACPSDRAYMDPADSGTCYPCDSTCASCTGPEADECTSCDKGQYLSGTSSGYCYTCDSSCVECDGAGPYACTACESGEYLIPDGHCDVDCYLPLVITTNDVTDLCIVPDGCSSTYVYWDATCESTCTFPLVSKVVDSYFKLCTYPCAEEQYLYWDGTCHSDCPSPLTKRTTRAKLFCDWTCSSGSGAYLYWDGVCGSTCSSPLSYHTVGITGYVKYICDYPCESTQYLYWNGSCIDSCVTPLTKSTTHSANLCSFPCTPVTNVAYWDGSCSTTCLPPRTLVAEGDTMVRYFCRYKCGVGEFLYWNGTCVSECVPPLTYSYENGKWFCNYPCAAGEFLLWNGTCQSTCASPLVVRVEAGLYYCDYPCSMLTEYLYWNGSCMSSCNYPLQVSFDAAARFCNFPCTTSSNYLYWDGTCSSTCSSPLVQVTEGSPLRKYCIYPCDSDAYLYWNGSCGDACPTPFEATASVGKNYCDYPCTSLQYLYWNGSCYTSCSSPLAIRVDNAGALYCDFPCTTVTDYLYWDGTCLETCPSPLANQTQGGGEYARNFCYFGCSGSTPYLYWNETCGAACDYPFQTEIERGEYLCQEPCDDDETEYYYEDSQTCKATCLSPYIIDKTYSFNRCLSPEAVESASWFVRNILTAPSEPGAVTFVNVVKMMQWVKYFDIKMPPRLQKFALSQGRSVLSLKIGWTMSEVDQENYVRSSLPRVFQRHGFPSSFLVNYWQYLTTMLLVGIAAILFTILEKAAKIYNRPSWQSIFETLRAITRWSTLLILISTSIDDVVLFTSFQFRTLSASASSGYTILAFLVSLVMMGMEVVFFAGTYWLCVRAQASLKTAISKEKSMTRMQFMISKRDFQVVFKGFQANFLLSQVFYLVYTLRLAVPMIIAAYLYSYQFAQSILQVAVNLVILLYVVFAKPIEKRINHIQLVVMELLYLLMNISMLILTALDKSNQTLTDFGIFLGDLVIFCNFLVNVLLLFFLFIKIMSETRLIRDTIKQNKSTGLIGLWLQLLALPIQQGGMGFEEMIGTHSFSTQYQLLQTTQSSPPRSLQPQNRPHKTSVELSSSISPQRGSDRGEVSPKSQILHRPQFDVDESEAPVPSLFYPQATHGTAWRFNESLRSTQRRSRPPTDDL